MTNSQIQFIGTTPEAFSELLEKSILKHLEALKQNFQPKEPTEFLTRKEVSVLLKINLSTLHHWTKSGKLQSYGIGNRIFLKRSEVEAMIKPLN